MPNDPTIPTAVLEAAKVAYEGGRNLCSSMEEADMHEMGLCAAIAALPHLAALAERLRRAERETASLRIDNARLRDEAAWRRLTEPLTQASAPETNSPKPPST